MTEWAGRADGVSVTFFTLPVQGHVGAALPVVRELVDRGASVRALTTPAYRAALEAAGAEVVEYPAEFAAQVEDPSANFVTVAALLARLTRTSLLSVATAELQARRPDVVMVDSMAPWGLLAARRLAIPVVTSTSSFIVHGGLGASPQAALDILRRLPVGLAGLASIAATRVRLRRSEQLDPGGPIRLLSSRGDASIVYTSRTLQPGADRLRGEIAYVGATLPQVGAGVAGAADAERAAHPGAPVPVDSAVATSAITPDVRALLDAVGDGPLTYVSLGTLYNDRPDFYRACIDALGGGSRTLVIAVGRRVDATQLGPLPAGAHVVCHAPQLALLERAELFITHAGMNSVHEALWHGVPMVAFPQAADQPVVAARVAQLGAGRVLRGRSPSAVQIRKAAESVLAGGRAAARAAAIGQTLRAGGGAPAAANVVLAHAARSTPQRRD